MVTNDKLLLGGLLLMLSIVSGCFDDENVGLSVDDLDLSPRILGPIATGERQTINDMSEDAIIVAVNGRPLLKRDYNEMMTLRAKGIMQEKGMNSMMAEKLLEQYSQTVVKTFVAQRLLVDNAYSLGVVTTNEVLDHIAEKLREKAKRRSKSVAAIQKRDPKEFKYTVYELGVSYVMNKLIKKKIPPAADVNEKFVEAVKNQVRSENAAASKTNEMIKTRLANYRQQIIDKKLDFMKVAQSISAAEIVNGNSTALEADDAAYWGEFEEGDFDSKEMESAIFALKEGEISRVLEDDNAYRLVKVISVSPAVTNENGRIVKRESRKLQQIYVDKIPLLLEDTDIAMTADLRNQMQLIAINNYVQGLSTNRENRIEYPHGTSFFK